MAKRKRTKKPETAEPDADAAAARPHAPSSEPAQDFLGSLREGFKAAGHAAERYARLGVNLAELETLRLKLKSAYATLGENVMRCWDAAPDLGVAATDPLVRAQAKTVSDLRRRIRELEIKQRSIKQS